MKVTKPCHWNHSIILLNKLFNIFPREAFHAWNIVASWLNFCNTDWNDNKHEKFPVDKWILHFNKVLVKAIKIKRTIKSSSNLLNTTHHVYEKDDERFAFAFLCFDAFCMNQLKYTHRETNVYGFKWMLSTGGFYAMRTIQFHIIA